MRSDNEKIFKFLKPAVSAAMVCIIVFAAVINCANDSSRVVFGFEAQSETDSASVLSESEMAVSGDETESALPADSVISQTSNDAQHTTVNASSSSKADETSTTTAATTEKTTTQAPTTTTKRYVTTTRYTLSSLFSNSSYRNSVISITNSERRNAGLHSLSKSSSLMAAAQTRAEECASLDSIRVNGQSHRRPDGSAWYTVMGVTQNYNYGENTGQGCDTPEYMMEIWMASDGHRGNILKEEYTEIGVGCAVSEDGTVFCVQIFYQP